MNLDTCTTYQRHVIRTLDKPLMVAAGAGSGKTFTLTQRIVAALLPGESGEPFLESVDEVLAITFTRKAAAELKERIKGQLFREGLDAEALKVDDAWITTIHGACSRILREHALEVGIDPTFELVEGAEEEEFRRRALTSCLMIVYKGEASVELQGLLDRIGAQSLYESALALASRVNALPQGFEGLAMAQPTESAVDVLRPLYLKGCEYRSVANEWVKPTKTDLKHLADLEGALARANAYIQSAQSTNFADPAFDASCFLEVLFSFPKTSPKYRAKKDDAGFFEEYRLTYAEVAAKAVHGCTFADRCALAEFAQLFEREYERIKGPSKLDANDLLLRTARALKSHPELQEDYRSQFKLIMVDEFQDTDKLQVDIVSCLASPDKSNVCTVGDAQQSIYRFRGADVNVFFDFREQLAKSNPDTQLVELPDNFRSHADVLQAVEQVFSQRNVFGGRFLKLAARGKVNSIPDAQLEGFPRVNMSVVASRGRSVAPARELAARRIAEHFAELRERGASPKDMVLLLGSMSKVDLYANALQEKGFESLIAGGSVFADQPEVSLVSSMCAWFANKRDSQAAYQVLSSGLFDLSDDVLLALARAGRKADPEGKRNLALGFDAVSDEDQAVLSERDKAELARAKESVRQAFASVQLRGVAAAVRELAYTSGWLSRLERSGAEGLFCAGNVLKCLRMLQDIEDEGLGAAGVAGTFASTLESSKEKPGSLATCSSDFVRIMTIHASKGLEFPHVAVAELRDGLPRSQSLSLMVENVGDATCFAWKAKLNAEQDKILKELEGIARTQEEREAPSTEGEMRRLADDPAAFAGALFERVRDEELQEARRLLYVAMTRASKTLLLSYAYKATKPKQSDPDDALSPYEGKGVIEDLYTALQWEPSAEGAVQMLPYGGSAPARVVFDVAEELEDRDQGQVSTEFVVPELPAQVLVPRISYQPYHAGRKGVASYSSLPHDGPYSAAMPVAASEHASQLGADPWQSAAVVPVLGALEATDPDEVPDLLPEGALPLATELGTAFHRLAERAICQAQAQGLKTLAAPDTASIDAMAVRFKLSAEQMVRLREAVGRWFGSQCARSLAGHEYLSAEVPFFVPVKTEQGVSYLEGEIDALACDELPEESEAATAFLVDYKTGGFPDESAEQLQAKHGLQASCYAYALMKQGFARVEAAFVRVEQEDPSQQGEPQVVRFSFTLRDLPRLEDDLARRFGMQG